MSSIRTAIKNMNVSEVDRYPGRLQIRTETGSKSISVSIMIILRKFLCILKLNFVEGTEFTDTTLNTCPMALQGLLGPGWVSRRLFLVKLGCDFLPERLCLLISTSDWITGHCKPASSKQSTLARLEVLPAFWSSSDQDQW